MSYDFANILFSGQCNLRCPYCIGQSALLQEMPDNLQVFPLAGLEPFVTALQQHTVCQISLTGTNTDPQLYRYEARLIAYLRDRIPGVKLALHTNGQLARKNMATFNLYDRATISIPSFRPETYQALTGSARMPELRAILRTARIPIKISTILTGRNADEIPEIIERCRALSISRLVLRKPYNDTRQWRLFPHASPIRHFGGNPVYDIDGLEVTVWDFAASTTRCLNLFSNGTISDEYRIAGRSHPRQV